MRFLAVVLACLGFFCLAQAQVPMTGAGIGAPSSGGSYTGPGDIVTFTAWYGLRGYSAAYSTGSNPAADVCDTSTGLTCSTINILSNGNFDKATASASTACAVACVISKLYDQTAGAVHAVQATNANRPALTFNALNSNPCGTFNGTSSDLKTTGSYTPTRPFSFSALAKRTGNTSSNQNIIGLFGTSFVNNANLGFVNSANTIGIYSGSNISATASDNAFHAIQTVINGASSSLVVDGSTTSGNSGANSLTAQPIDIGSDDNAQFMTGVFCEGGYVNGTISGGNITSLNSNQHTYWSF